MSKAIRQMASYCSNHDNKPMPPPFPVLQDMPLRHEKWAARIHQDNEIESCSFLMYVSNFQFCQDRTNRLVLHTDGQNGKKKGWDYLATF
jgi:hypothetical protein